MSELVKIEEFQDLPLAELAKAKLQAEGIYCQLQNKHHVAMNWSFSLALGGVRLFVRKQDEQKAKEILDTDESELISDVENQFPAAEEDDLCQRCGSQDLEYINRARFFGALSMLIGLPLSVFGIRYKCRKCGHLMKPLNKYNE